MEVKVSKRKRCVVHLKCKAPNFAWYLNERRWFFPVHPFLSCEYVAFVINLSLSLALIEEAAENGFRDAMLKLWHLYFYLCPSSIPPNPSIFSRWVTLLLQSTNRTLHLIRISFQFQLTTGTDSRVHEGIRGWWFFVAWTTEATT